MHPRPRTVFLAVLAVLIVPVITATASASTPFHDLFGDTLDVREAESHGLFHATPGFRRAWIAEHDYTTHSDLVIERVELGRSVTDTLVVREHVLALAPSLLSRAPGMDSTGSPGDSTTGRHGLPAIVSLDGSAEYRGWLIEWDGPTLHLDTGYGVLRFPLDAIDRIEPVENPLVRADEFWFADPNRNRLFVMPTAHSMQHGVGQAGLYEIVFPLIRFRLPFRLELGGGAFPFSGMEEGLYWATGKATVYEDNRLSLALGGTRFWEDITDTRNEGYGAAYLLATYGTERAALTVGLGAEFDGRWALKDEPVIGVGGMLRLREHFSLLTETWLPNEKDWAYSSLGMRVFSSFFAVDFAMVFAVQEDDVGFAFPLLNLVVSY